MSDAGAGPAQCASGGTALEPLDEKTAGQFEVYLSLFLRWNERLI